MDDRYDASRAPDADAWLALDEAERMLLVEAYHARAGAELPTKEQRRGHATAHVIAETQLAMDDPPEARRTLARLLRAGVSRHSAIHAIANEMMVVMHGLLKEGGNFAPEQYEKALQAIDPDDWLHDTAGLPDA